LLAKDPFAKKSPARSGSKTESNRSGSSSSKPSPDKQNHPMQVLGVGDKNRFDGDRRSRTCSESNAMDQDFIIPSLPLGE
jgi:hypothetical protein